MRRAAATGLTGLALLGCMLAPVAGWTLTTESADVWPMRNTLQYALVSAWWDLAGRPTLGEPTTVIGSVRDGDGRVLGGVRVLLTAWDGTTYSGRSAADGNYRIEQVPGGTYAAVAGVPGQGEAVQRMVRLGGGGRTLNLLLGRKGVGPAVAPDDAQPSGQRTAISDAFSTTPIPARALRWELPLTEAGHASGRLARTRGERALLYLPWDANQGNRSNPLLLTAYPGPADEWESASVPLAAAGYAVVAYGPPYSFEPERAVGALRGIISAARLGRLPGVDASRIAVLGGSYSGMHVLRLLQLEHGNAAIKAAVLMGAPADLFDMRRRLEDRSFVPPFGLDQALVALGFPDREPLRYWRYSGAYHVRAGVPPALLIHSRQDDVVPYQQSELLARTFSEVGVPHELHLLDGGSHYLLSAEPDARRIYELTLRFLRDTLG